MSKIGDSILEGLQEALAYVEGKDAPGIRVHHVATEGVDAKAIRKRLGITQDRMALFLGTSTSGYRKWEQGQRQPSGAARTLLRVMEKEPDAVLRVLAAD